jgi:hypothetical protein
LHIRFDLDFDGAVWPGPLGGRDAACGEAWLGPTGLLDRLEAVLGLGGAWPDPTARAVAFAAALDRVPGFWSRSLEADPLATARTLLEWRDGLRLGGWEGQPVGASRIDRLAEVAVLPGIAERLAEVERALGRGRVEIERVDVLAAPAELPVRWRRVLQATGARVGAWVLPPVHATASLPSAAGRGASAPLVARAGGRGAAAGRRPLTFSSGSVLVAERGGDASGDISGWRAPGFRPRGDGSLQLLRPDGALAAADEVAAWLAAQSSLESTVVVGADEVLERALRRHGLPVTGALEREGATLAVLPLALRAALSPADPEAMLAFLSQPGGPIPASGARLLVDALRTWPAVGGAEWRRALGEARLGALEVLVTPTFERGFPVRVGELVERLSSIEEACGGKVGEHCRRVREALRGRESLSLGALLGLVDACAPALERVDAQAGLTAVASPGAIAGPVRRLVWWGFRRETSPRGMPFSASERAALAAAGVELPDPALRAVASAARARRPLEQAMEAAVLVCPRLDERGQEQFVHPVWDEVTARLADWGDVARLEGRVPTAGRAALRVERRLRPLPRPRHDWRAPSLLLRARERESPSSLQMLAGCSLQWVLQYGARLRPGRSAALPGANELLGRVAHEMMAAVLGEGALAPEAVRARAETFLENEAAGLAGALFLAVNERERMAAFAAMVEAAVDFAALLARRAGEVEAVERALRADGLEGRPDAIVRLDGRRTVVDFKWGGGTRYQESLRAGSAVQLAAYAELAGAEDVAYYVMSERRWVDRGRSPSEMWAAFQAALDARFAELADGRVHADGHPSLEGFPPVERSRIEEGRLRLKPGCHFCDFRRICEKRDG